MSKTPCNQIRETWKLESPFNLFPPARHCWSWEKNFLLFLFFLSYRTIESRNGQENLSQTHSWITVWGILLLLFGLGLLLLLPLIHGRLHQQEQLLLLECVEDWVCWAGSAPDARWIPGDNQNENREKGAHVKLSGSGQQSCPINHDQIGQPNYNGFELFWPRREFVIQLGHFNSIMSCVLREKRGNAQLYNLVIVQPHMLNVYKSLPSSIPEFLFFWRAEPWGSHRIDRTMRWQSSVISFPCCILLIASDYRFAWVVLCSSFHRRPTCQLITSDSFWNHRP